MTTIDLPASLQQVSDVLFTNSTNAAGETSKERAFEAIRDYLLNTPGAIDVDAVAWQLTNQSHRRLTASRPNGQRNFFQPDNFFALGGGNVVRQRKATLAHLNQWWAVQQKEHAASLRAHADKTDWYLARTAVHWNADTLLEDVERDHFGWTEE